LVAGGNWTFNDKEVILTQVVTVWMLLELDFSKENCMDFHAVLVTFGTPFCMGMLKKKST
jgi:hypothetical protein